jgi:hypothetical protein
MTIEVRSVDNLNGGTPLTKLRHLYKTVWERGLTVHVVKERLLITQAVLDELMRWDAKTFDHMDCPARRVLLKLRRSRENGPCRSSVSDSFKEETKTLEAAVELFFLLVRRETVDTEDPEFLEDGMSKPSDESFA